MNLSLECLISKNLRYITIKSIEEEFIYVFRFYKLYIVDIEHYIKSISEITTQIDIFYKNIFYLCLQKINGLNTLSTNGSILLYVIRYLERIKEGWFLYLLRLKTFYQSFCKYFSKYIYILNSNQTHDLRT